MTQLSQCPVCGEKILSPFQKCIDYTVSHETFQIVTCSKCQFAFTNPYPDLTKLGDYYLSSDYVSHSSKPTGIIDNIYVLARNVTLKWKTNLVQKHSAPKAKTLLDYGCGAGDFLNTCNQKGWKTQGIEPSPTARSIAADKTKQIIHSTIEELPATSFDVITLWHVLEHVPNFHELLETLRDKLTQTGTIFIAVPNRNSWDANHYQDTWAAYDVPRHLWHFRQEDIQKIMNAHSLNVVRTLPMKLDAYYVSLLSEKYRSKKLNLQAIFKSMIAGLRSNISAAATTEYSSIIYVITK